MTNYEMAEQLRLKIEELKRALEISKKQNLNQKHFQEQEKLDNIFKAEMAELEMKYQKIFSDIEQKERMNEEKLNEKHRNEMQSLYTFLDRKLPRKIYHSKTYLDLKSMEINLAKQQKYKDALLIKKQCETLEKYDAEKFNKDTSERIKSQSIKTANKHLNEKNVFKKKIELDYEEARKRKEEEIQVLILKFRNRKTDLENQQKNENLLCENNNKLKALTTTNKLKNRNYLFNNSTANFSTNEDEYA